MKRREFITLIGGAAAWPLAARAQQPLTRLRKVGVLIGRPAEDPEGQEYAAALNRGLHELGWSSPRNIEIEYRWHSGDAAKAGVLAKELVELDPDLLVANTTPSLAAVRQATRTTPIVFVGVADPVTQGFVQNLARPGGNITGFGLEEPEMGAKWVEVVREIAPRLRSITVLFNPTSAPYGRMFLPSIEAACESPAIEFGVATVHSASDIENVMSGASRGRTNGLIVLPDSFLFAHREMIATLAAKRGSPAVYAYRGFVTSGGLVAYAIDRVELFHRAASYIDRILKGDLPGDLPVQQPTKFLLVVNLRAARDLNLEVPPTLLARADEVIE
jgi:putative tryptophan/tyrosine transport system substrate-binding protein